MSTRRVSGRWAVLAIVALPVLAIALIFWWVDVGNRNGPKMDVPRIGAGAGDSGGANAIGEWREGRAQRDDAPVAPPQLIAPETLPQGFTLVVEDASGRATDAAPVFLASDFNAWNPSDSALKLARRADGLWAIQLRQPGGGKPMAFKFTRGSWDAEELDAAGKPIANRTLAKIDVSTLAPEQVPDVRFKVERWAEAAPKAPSTTGDVRRIELPGPAGGDSRELLVWLPPGYEEGAAAGSTYAVLYMFDGQNIFEAPPGVPGEWRADETATALIGAKEIRPLIIVGMPHGGEARLSEYMPARRDGGESPLAGRAATGAETLQWVLELVLPAIERQFKVASGPENTGIGGSSLGGLMALYGAAQAPDVFGRALVESPTLSLGEPARWKWSDAMSLKRLSARVWLGIGGREESQDEASDAAKADANKQYVMEGQALAAAIGEEGDVVHLSTVVLGRHNEEAWAQRLPRALKYLFPPEADGTK